MLIRKDLAEVQGKPASVAGPGTISPARLPTLLLGGLLLLIGP
jgi:hypothetical protein